MNLATTFALAFLTLVAFSPIWYVSQNLAVAVAGLVASSTSGAIATLLIWPEAKVWVSAIASSLSAIAPILVNRISNIGSFESAPAEVFLTTLEYEQLYHRELILGSTAIIFGWLIGIVVWVVAIRLRLGRSKVRVR